ncbi:MAG: DUF3769 domain-containing protein [Prochlorococcaceae cyanobacterium]
MPREVELRADQQTYDNQLKRLLATGNVSAVLAGGRLLADRLEYASESRTIYAYGRIRFQRGSQYLQASRLRFSLIEGSGEMEDVYGVLDLDSSQQDLDINTMPPPELPEAQPMACPPLLPALPNWHPYPWAITAWGGQMVDSEFGETFLFQGTPRPEAIGGIGLQRRLIDGGPFALEIDANLIGHKAWPQAGGGFNQSDPGSLNPAQSFAELTTGLGLRAWLQPWLSVAFVEGVSLNSEVSFYEKTFRKNYSQFLNYLAFEVEALVAPQWSLVGRIHHRSGAFGVYSDVREGSNGYLMGMRYRFGSDAPPRRKAELPPPIGCSNAPSNPPGPTPVLPDRLNNVAMEANKDAPGAAPAEQPAATDASGASQAKGKLWQRARSQERQRDAAVASINQRVSDVQFQQSLTAQRRRGVSDFSFTSNEAQFSGAAPSQLKEFRSKEGRQLVSGSISRWRFQAARIEINNNQWRADRAGFTNDPYTPAQSWLDTEDVLAYQSANGDTMIESKRNRLFLEDRLPIPVSRKQRFRKQEEVDNRWVLESDGEDRDGRFVGYNLNPIKIGRSGSLQLQPQFLSQRAINGVTDSYILPGAAPGDSASTQPAQTGDLFGLVAKLNLPVAGFAADATLDMSTFNPDNIANGTRSWGSLRRSLKLPLLGKSTLRLFGAYRYRIWNGSLGEQDVYSAYGISLEDRGKLPTWGRLNNGYYWRIGVGNYQANQFQSDNLADLWRGNLYAALNSSLPLWTGKPLAPGPNQGEANQNTAAPIIPGLSLNSNLNTSLAYYGDGTNQNTLSLSGGPTLTLGHFTKPFLDYTQLTVTAGGTLRQGVSPLGFDRAVDLGTLGIGLTQQIVGPLVFSGGVGFNIDSNSEFYGDITNSYVEVRWQRRAYEIGVFYSPYEQIGGVRVKLNDFNFKGSGVPFVPYQPQSGRSTPDRLF